MEIHGPSLISLMVSVADVKHHVYLLNSQSSGAVRKSRWPSWAPVPDKPAFSVDVKQHLNNMLGVVRRSGLAVSRRASVLTPIRFSSSLFKSCGLRMDSLCEAAPQD